MTMEKNTAEYGPKDIAKMLAPMRLLGERKLTFHSELADRVKETMGTDDADFIKEITGPDNANFIKEMARTTRIEDIDCIKETTGTEDTDFVIEFLDINNYLWPFDVEGSENGAYMLTNKGMNLLRRYL